MITERFIQVKTKSNFEKKLEAGEIKDTSIAFIEDTNQIWAKGKYYSAVPSEGHSGQVLTWKSDGEAKWEDPANTFENLEELLAYGVQIDTTVADPHLTRIGNMTLHKALPIQSQLKGCIGQGNRIMYFLDADDWRWRQNPTTKSMTVTVTDDAITLTDTVFSTLLYEKQWVKVNDVAALVNSIDTATSTATLLSSDDLAVLTTGTATVELGAVLNGYDGQVMVSVPQFYIRSEQVSDTVYNVWISTIKISDAYTKQDAILVGAYRSTVLNTVPTNMGYLSTLPVNSAISVVNTNTYCRGGSNNSNYDTYLTTDQFRTQLCKPRTLLNRATMRTYCRNADLYMLSYDQYKNIFYWLWVIEYANFNSQEAYNATLTDEGYRQGGMGNGITTIGWSYWDNYNESYPLTPCGYGNTLGNGTGVIDLVIPEYTYGSGSTESSITFSMPRWRGFDNPFGDIWTNIDGIILKHDVAGADSTVYTCQDPDKYSDTITDDYHNVGTEKAQEGYIKTFNLGEAAHIIPSAMGGNTTLYVCDYHWCSTSYTGNRTLLVGGGAVGSAGAGLARFDSPGGVSGVGSNVGFRAVSAAPAFAS